MPSAIRQVLMLASANILLQAQADQSKAKAQAEHNASHTAARFGGVSVSSTGVPAVDSQDRTQGQWEQTIGSAKETIGGLIGSEGLKQQGRDQNRQGQGQEAQGQLSDLGQGISDRVQGTVGGAFAGLTGDHDKQQLYMDQHDEGKSRRRGVEVDLDKKAQAEANARR